MTPQEKEQLEHIEEDRRERENRLLLLLLLLIGDAETAARNVAVLGGSVGPAIESIVLRPVNGLSAILRQAADSAFHSAVEMSGSIVPGDYEPPRQPTPEEYKGAVDPQKFADALVKRIRKSLGDDESPAAEKIAEAFDTAGVSRDNPKMLAEVAATQVNAGYQPGLFGGWASNPVVTGFRFVNPNDHRTSPVCLARINPPVQLPKDHPWWRRNLPPLHFDCRSSITGIIGNYVQAASPPNLPAPQPGFGFAPTAWTRAMTTNAHNLSLEIPELETMNLSAEDDMGGHWRTISGAHVLIGSDGTILKGPARLSHLIGKHHSELIGGDKLHVRLGGEGSYNAVTKASGLNPPTLETKAHAPIVTDKAFAHNAQAAAQRVSARGPGAPGVSSLGDKVLVSHAHAEYEKAHGAMPLATFKQRLSDVNGDDHGVSLVREDLVPAERAGEFAASEVKRGASSYHYIRTGKPGQAAPRSVDSDISKAHVDAVAKVKARRAANTMPEMPKLETKSVQHGLFGQGAVEHQQPSLIPGSASSGGSMRASGGKGGSAPLFGDGSAEMKTGRLFDRPILETKATPDKVESVQGKDGADRTTPPAQAPQRSGEIEYRNPSKQDLVGKSIHLWHGTTIESAKRIASANKIGEGGRGRNASADVAHADQYPEDSGAEALVLVKANPKSLSVDPNDQIGDTVKDGLFPKGFGSSTTLGDHSISAVFDVRGANPGYREALQSGDFAKAKKLGVKVIHNSFNAPSPAASGGITSKPTLETAARPDVSTPVDPSRQFGLFAKDASGEPAEIGEKIGQANLFGKAKYAMPEPPKLETRAVVGSANASDPKHTAEIPFGEKIYTRKPLESQLPTGDRIIAGDMVAPRNQFDLKLVPIDKLQTTEEIDTPSIRDKYEKAFRSNKRVDPIVVDRFGRVRDGHHRLQAAQQAGMTHIWAMRQRSLGSAKNLSLDALDLETINLDSSEEADIGGGAWRTIDGTHVYIKGGVIEKGPSAIAGKKVSDLPPRSKPMTEKDHHREAGKHLNGIMEETAKGAKADHGKIDEHHKAIETHMGHAEELKRKNAAEKSAPHKMPQKPTLETQSAGAVPVDVEVAHAAKSGKLNIPTGADGKIDPHLEAAYRRYAAKHGLEIGKFEAEAGGESVTAKVGAPEKPAMETKATASPAAKAKPATMKDAPAYVHAKEPGVNHDAKHSEKMNALEKKHSDLQAENETSKAKIDDTKTAIANAKEKIDAVSKQGEARDRMVKDLRSQVKRSEKEKSLAEDRLKEHFDMPKGSTVSYHSSHIGIHAPGGETIRVPHSAGTAEAVASAAKEPKVGLLAPNERRYLAGQNRGTLKFEDQHHQDLYDHGNALNKGQTPPRASEDRLLQHHGGDVDAVNKSARATYKDVKDQAKGLKDGETRTVKNRAMPEAPKLETKTTAQPTEKEPTKGDREKELIAQSKADHAQVQADAAKAENKPTEMKPVRDLPTGTKFEIHNIPVEVVDTAQGKAIRDHGDLPETPVDALRGDKLPIDKGSLKPPEKPALETKSWGGSSTPPGPAFPAAAGELKPKYDAQHDLYNQRHARRAGDVLREHMDRIKQFKEDNGNEHFHEAVNDYADELDRRTTKDRAQRDINGENAYHLRLASHHPTIQEHGEAGVNIAYPPRGKGRSGGTRNMSMIFELPELETVAA